MSYRRSRIRWALALSCFAMLGSACGGPGDQLREDLAADGLSDASINCVMDAFADAGIEPNDLSSITFDAQSEFATSPCMNGVFEELFADEFAVLGEEFVSSFGEGFNDDDPIELDEDLVSGDGSTEDMGGLAEACRIGDNRACDELWLVSPIDSAEEQLAESCGGRSAEIRMGSCEFWLE